MPGFYFSGHLGEYSILINYFCALHSKHEKRKALYIQILAAVFQLISFFRQLQPDHPRASRLPYRFGGWRSQGIDHSGFCPDGIDIQTI